MANFNLEESSFFFFLLLLKYSIVDSQSKKIVWKFVHTMILEPGWGYNNNAWVTQISGLAYGSLLHV